MKHSQYLFVLIITIFVSLVDTVADPATHKIGVLLPLTGEVAGYGAKVRAGIESISHDGIELIYEDDACRSSHAEGRNSRWQD